jgi:hypothetical protein
MTNLRSIIEALLDGSRLDDDAFEALLADLPTATELEIAKGRAWS